MLNFPSEITLNKLYNLRISGLYMRKLTFTNNAETYTYQCGKLEYIKTGIVLHAKSAKTMLKARF